MNQVKATLEVVSPPPQLEDFRTDVVILEALSALTKNPESAALAAYASSTTSALAQRAKANYKEVHDRLAPEVQELKRMVTELSEAADAAREQHPWNPEDLMASATAAWQKLPPPVTLHSSLSLLLPKSRRDQLVILLLLAIGLAVLVLAPRSDFRLLAALAIGLVCLIRLSISFKARFLDSVTKRDEVERGKRVDLASQAYAAFLESFGSEQYLAVLELARKAKQNLTAAARSQWTQILQLAANELATEKNELATEEADKHQERLWGEKLRVVNRSALDDDGQDLWVAIPAFDELSAVMSISNSYALGIAGPRGAGKTSLLRRLSEGRDGLGFSYRIQLSAPVDFSSRDFLLHLFATVCKAVGGRDLPIYEPARMEKESSAYKKMTDAFGIIFALTAGSFLVRSFSLRVSSPTFCFAACAVLALALMIRSMISKANTADDSLDWKLYKIKSNRYTGPFFALGTSMLLVAPLPPGVRPGAITGLLITGGLLLWGSRSRSTQGLRRFFGIPIFLVPHRLEQIMTIKEAKASELLRTIRFQLSYTSGWSGGVTAAVPLLGLSATRLGTGQHSWSPTQRTVPEIVEDFKQFMSELNQGSRGKTLILIDEVDKIEDPTAARKFINEIKTLFGASGCCFVVTVSEEALRSFETRGVTLRNEFDSAFDDVLRIGFFNFHHMVALSNRRIVGPSLVFLALVHALSGGLPREIVRNLRFLASIATEDTAVHPELSYVALRMVDRMLRGAAHAVLEADYNGEDHSILLQLTSVSFADLSVLNRLAFEVVQRYSNDCRPEGLVGRLECLIVYSALITGLFTDALAAQCLLGADPENSLDLPLDRLPKMMRLIQKNPGQSLAEIRGLAKDLAMNVPWL
jgi:hypothetical protein